MSGPDGHEREPDQAALDELERAFSDGEGAISNADNDPVLHPDDRGGDDRGDDDLADDLAGGPAQADEPAVPAWAVDRDAVAPDEDRPDEILIVEAVSADPTPPAPRIIRIDDYKGSVAVEDLQPAPNPNPSGRGGAADQSADQEEDQSAAQAEDQPAVQAEDQSAVQAEDQPADLSAGQAAAGAPVVIAIEDEDLPDAVYIEGSLERSSSRSIVFIDDNDSDDAFVPETERDVRRGIEPRMRERRVAVKRAQGRKRLKWVLLAVVIVVIVVGTLATLGSSLFAIQEDQVFVTGNVYTDVERLQAVIDDLVGTPVLLADTQAAERQLEAIPWVEAARVRISFPHSASIEIRERKAIATYQGPDERFRVLDRSGRVLDVIDNYPLAYVLLGGPDPVDLDAGQFAPYGYAAAADLGKNLTGSIRGRVHLIEVTADGSLLVMHIDDGVQVRFGEARDLLVKLVRLETVLSAGVDEDSTVIDVSTNQATL